MVMVKDGPEYNILFDDDFNNGNYLEALHPHAFSLSYKHITY